MLLQIPDVLTADQVRAMRARLAEADWTDGRATAGHQSLRAKDNLQLPESSALAREFGDLVVAALARNSSFFAAALPRRVYPPLFNAYSAGQSFGFHVDNAVRHDRRPGAPTDPIRTDLSATLFLGEPGDYDGGELLIEDTYGEQRVKLPAGHLVLYPGSSLHRVTPVTRGTRLACFFWIQSLVRSDEQRSILFNLDVGIRQLTQRDTNAPELVRLTGVYHNLLRQWAET